MAKRNDVFEYKKAKYYKKNSYSVITRGIFNQNLDK